jgi:hypothetical protein
VIANMLSFIIAGGFSREARTAQVLFVDAVVLGHSGVRGERNMCIEHPLTV